MKIRVSLKSDKNYRYFTWRPIYVHLWSHPTQFFLEWEIIQTKVVERIQTHVLCSVTCYRKIVPVMKKMWKNTVGPDRPEVTIQRISISSRTSKATDTPTQNMQHLPFFHGNNGHANAILCYVKSTLPVLLFREKNTKPLKLVDHRRYSFARLSCRTEAMAIWQNSRQQVTTDSWHIK